MPAGRMLVRSLLFCYSEQTAGLRSANFFSHMYVEKVNSLADFNPNRQRP